MAGEGDKRSVHTDALETLGMKISAKEKRDAIYLAVEPAIAGEKLFAGQHVGFYADGTVRTGPRPLGIVDPFLLTPVEPGEMF